jgi:VCBS repeat-containing protein
MKHLTRFALILITLSLLLALGLPAAAMPAAAPLAVDDGGVGFTTSEDTPFTTASVLANDFDPDGDLLAVDSYALSGTLGLVSNNGDGTFAYYPNGQFESLAEGQQAVELFTYVISDSTGLTDTALVSITVLGANDPPVVVAGPDVGVTEGESISFTGVYTDPDGVISDQLPVTSDRGRSSSALSVISKQLAMGVLWEFGDGITETGTLTPSHAYGDEGVYTVTLTVTDELGAAGWDMLLVTATNAAPQLSGLSDLAVYAGQPFTVTGVLTDPSWLDIHLVVFTWAASQTQEITLSAGLTGFSVAHVYDFPSTYSVLLELRSDGGTDSAVDSDCQCSHDDPLHLHPFIQLTAPVPLGPEHSCAIQADGALACWGYNGWRQSGPPEGFYQQVSMGAAHTCALSSDGTLACWGYNFFGQSEPPTGTFEAVSAGYLHSCGLRSNGTLACWGDDSYGQSTPPAGLFTQVSAGGQHTCAVQSDGALLCWGDDSFGQSTPPAGTFAQVSSGSDFSCGLRDDHTLACWGADDFGQSTPPAGAFNQVSAGNGFACALALDGTLACWGENSAGQATPPAGTFTQLLTGRAHACAVQADGAMVCWGDDNRGQATPPEVNFGQPQVDASRYHSCGVDFDGTLRCWGDPGYGWGQSDPPTGTFRTVSTGVAHSCGLASDGTIACWGNDSYGQATPPAGSFAQMDAGWYHTCAVAPDSTLACWGDNYWGQTDPPTGTFRQVSAGAGLTCAMRSDGPGRGR